MTLMVIIYILIFIIFALAAYAVMQIKLAGINVKDFWSFIEANQILDKLYEFSKKYKTLSPQQQVVYLMEAEKVFTAFDKIPDIIWEDEFKKYDEVLKKYNEIKVNRWVSSSLIRRRHPSIIFLRSIFYFSLNFQIKFLLKFYPQLDFE